MARDQLSVIILSVGCALSLAGCANTAKRDPGLPDPLPMHSASPSDDPDSADVNKQASNLQAGFDQWNAKQAARESGLDQEPVETGIKPKRQTRDVATSAAREQPGVGAAGGLGANQAASVPENKPDSTDGKAKPGSKKEVAKSPLLRKQEAVQELVGQFKPDITGAKEPLRAAMPLIGLEAISPGSAEKELDSVLRAVGPDQRRTVEITKNLMRDLATNPNVVSGDPAAVARLLRERAEQLGGAPASDGLELGTVALCQRVDGFGRYTNLGISTFLAGRPAAMILYTEVENFSQRRAAEASKSEGAPSDQWRVELGQTVALYLESDGSEQLKVPESVVKDVSASKRRDFFLVQRIDLPRTLTVGNYNLKLTVRDAANGAIVERMIPIRIVADPSAIRRDSGVATSRSAAAGAAGQVAGTTK